MFAAPVVCLVGWVYGHPFALDMDPLLVIVLVFAVLHTCAPHAGLLQLVLTPSPCLCHPGTSRRQ